jgi:hypothetical protein
MHIHMYIYVHMTYIGIEDLCRFAFCLEHEKLLHRNRRQSAV